MNIFSRKTGNLRNPLWVLFAVLFLLTAITKTVHLMPGLALLLWVGYWGYRFSQERLINRSIPWKPVIYILIAMAVSLGTSPGRALFSQSARPLVVYSLEKKVKNNPDDQTTRSQLSTLYASTNQPAKAEPHLVWLLSRDSCDEIAWSNRALLALFAKEKEKSLFFSKKSVACDSTQAFSWDRLGMAYATVEKTDSAKIAWRKALSLIKPDDPLALRIRKNL